MCHGSAQIAIRQLLDRHVSPFASSVLHYPMSLPSINPESSPDARHNLLFPSHAEPNTTTGNLLRSTTLVHITYTVKVSPLAAGRLSLLQPTVVPIPEFTRSRPLTFLLALLCSRDFCSHLVCALRRGFTTCLFGHAVFRPCSSALRRISCRLGTGNITRYIAPHFLPPR